MNRVDQSQDLKSAGTLDIRQTEIRQTDNLTDRFVVVEMLDKNKDSSH